MHIHLIFSGIHIYYILMADYDDFYYYYYGLICRFIVMGDAKYQRASLLDEYTLFWEGPRQGKHATVVGQFEISGFLKSAYSQEFIYMASKYQSPTHGKGIDLSGGKLDG